MSLIFYDTETTGTEAAFDQILQFAAIRTDADFNELDRFEIRCRLHSHIVPSPMAMFVTRVKPNQLTEMTFPSHYEMVCALRKKLTSWMPANFLGYNSIEFDEHLLRQALYQTLHHPYLTNSSGNARSDVIRAVRACSQFAPDRLAFPIGPKGQRIFKLGVVALENGFNSHNAHDAMGDVEATIYLARMLAERAPDIWSATMQFSQKRAATDFVANERVFCFGEHYYGRPYAWTVTGIGVSQANSSDYFVFDLAVDPSSLENLDADQLAHRMESSPKPIRVVKLNGGPIFFPFPEMFGATSAGKLGLDKLEERIAFLEGSPQLRDRLVAAYLASKGAKEESPHVEQQIYASFTASDDLQLCEKFHQAPWEKREAILAKLKDRRLQHLGLRLIAIERPDVLSAQAQQEHMDWLRMRLLSEEDVPWLTLGRALQDIDDMIAGVDGEDAALLVAHRSMLQKCLDSHRSNSR
jgi:exodeoxyribonuclease-1